MGRQLLTCLVLCCACLGIIEGARPPSIYLQPSYDIFFKAGESVELPCEADAVPPPKYSWKMNGYSFNPSGNDDRIVQVPNIGTIIFIRPESKDEGVYQCFAKNDYGVSASIKINFQEAKLRLEGNQVGETYRPILSSSFTLRCISMTSVPPPDVFWFTRDQDGQIQAVDLDARVTMDHENNLKFTNVKLEDALGRKPYICGAMNRILRKMIQGPNNFIIPDGSTEEYKQVSSMWASPADSLGLLGQLFKIKCIFAGNPTPDVSWSRLDGKPFPEHVNQTSFGQELVFKQLKFSDQGEYQCMAVNYVTPQPVTRTISVSVEALPYWIEKPKDVTLLSGDDAVFRCLADGVPKPDVYWFINSVPLEEVSDPRINHRFKRQSPSEIVLMDVTPNDAMVIQCNITNKHGYIWADVYLNVEDSTSSGIYPSSGAMKMNMRPAVVFVFSFLMLITFNKS